MSSSKTVKLSLVFPVLISFCFLVLLSCTPADKGAPAASNNLPASGPGAEKEVRKILCPKAAAAGRC